MGRKKKLEEHQTHHRFGISNSREKKEETPHKTRREGNQRASPPPSRATKGTSRVFFSSFLLPRFFSLSLSLERVGERHWAKGFFVGKKRERSLSEEKGEGFRVTSQKKKTKKRRQKRRTV